MTIVSDTPVSTIPTSGTPVPATIWYLVTNHLNIYFMLASGLILPKSGFGKKYYLDPLDVFPGYIPLFCDPIPGTAFEMAAREAGHLMPVAAQVSLDHLAGPVAAIDLQGRLVRELIFPEQLTGRESVILIPAPLPVTWITALNVETAAAAKKCKKEIQEYSNVSIGDLPLKPLKKLFKTAGKEPTDLLTPTWTQAGPLHRDVPLDRAFSAGGIMGAAFQGADKNGYSMAAAAAAFGDPVPETKDGGKPVFTHRPLSWLVSGTLPTPDHTLTEKMFWGMAAAIADTSALPDANARDRAMDFLENQCVKWPAVATDHRLKTPLEQLTRDLSALDRGSSEFTRSQLFERHEKPFARAMILFFLHRDMPGMIETDNKKLTLEDLSAANLLVGAHRGWMGLPLEIKAGDVLAAAVTHRMASLSHTLAGTGLSLGPAPAPPMPFPALFEVGRDDEKWTAGQKKAALALAKALKWDCITTIILLGNGDYQLRSTPGGVEIILEGPEKRIRQDIQKEKFIEALTGADIPGKTYLDVRHILNNPR